MIEVYAFEARIYPSFKDSDADNFITMRIQFSKSFPFVSSSFFSILSVFKSAVCEKVKEFNQELNPKAFIFTDIINDSDEMDTVCIYTIQYIRNSLIAIPDTTLIENFLKGGNFK